MSRAGATGAGATDVQAKAAGATPAYPGRRDDLALPHWWALPAGVGAAFLLVPFVVLAARVPWSRLAPLLTAPGSRAALGLSLWTCAVATLLCLALGVPIAWFLAWGRGRWIAALRLLTTLPMVLPPVVAGLLLLLTWGRRGPLGRVLGAAGVEVGFTSVAVVIAQTFVALPYVVVSLEGALRARGLRYEATSRELGASWGATLRRISLPLTWPAVVAAGALAFARALGEFGATLTFAGSLEGVTRTLPLEIYLQREVDSDTALALSLLLIGVAALSVGVAGLLARLPVARPRGREGVVAGEPDAPTPEPAPPRTPGAPVVVNVDDPTRDVHVHTTLAPGGRYALIGPNGAGKSTTLGDVARSVPGAAFLTQHPTLFPHLSVLDNVAFPMSARGADPRAAASRATAELRAVGCAALADRAPTALSGGERQRVALARAMTLDPALLLLDEPMAGLDASAARRVRDALAARLDASGVTLLLATHEPADVAGFGCTALVLEGGRLVDQRPWRELRRSEAPFAHDFLTGVAAWD